MVSIVYDCLELGCRDGLRGKPVIANPSLGADRVAKAPALGFCEPMRDQIQLREALRQHKRVIVSIVRSTSGPLRETCTLLERGITLPDELRFRHSDAR